MSEKIYACLLRLFPSAFRRHYKEEALRLLRDRLRDERGFVRRLRLTLDLIADIIGALPKAYRNSYGEVAPAALFASQVEGAPSFRLLQAEPIRRVAIAVASVLSITALAIFALVMGLSIRYGPVARDGSISPIESVIEHLNQPISSNSAINGGSHTDAPPSVNISRSEPRPLAATNAVIASAARAANLPVQLRAQNPNANYPDQRPSLAVAAPSSLAQSQPQALSHVVVAINLSGRWIGSFGAVDGAADVPQWFIFKQNSANLTGTGGADSTEQYPIIHGLVAGNSVRFELKKRKNRFLYDLRFEDKALRGTLSIRNTSELRTTKVRLEREPAVYATTP